MKRILSHIVVGGLGVGLGVAASYVIKRPAAPQFPELATMITVTTHRVLGDFVCQPVFVGSHTRNGRVDFEYWAYRASFPLEDGTEVKDDWEAVAAIWVYNYPESDLVTFELARITTTPLTVEAGAERWDFDAAELGINPGFLVFEMTVPLVIEMQRVEEVSLVKA